MSINFTQYSAMCYGALCAMDEDQKKALSDWEVNNLDGCTVGTTDWPGWISIIGPPPKLPVEKQKKKVKRPIPQKLRIQVFERDRYRCIECGTWKRLTVDHIIPESRDGPTILENLQTLCRLCNSEKGTK